MKNMQDRVYIIMRIEGEYAYLRDENMCTACDELMIAMALLPLGVDVGSRLLYKDLEFSIL